MPELNLDDLNMDDLPIIDESDDDEIEDEELMSSDIDVDTPHSLANEVHSPKSSVSTPAPEGNSALIADETKRQLADLGFLAVLVQEGHETFEKQTQLSQQQLEKIGKLQKSIKNDMLELQSLFEYEDAQNYRKLCESTTKVAEEAVQKLDSGIQRSQSILEQTAKEATKSFSLKMFGVAVTTGVISSVIIASVMGAFWVSDIKGQLADKNAQLLENERSVSLGKSLHFYMKDGLYGSLTAKQKEAIDSIYVSQGFKTIGD